MPRPRRLRLASASASCLRFASLRWRFAFLAAALFAVAFSFLPLTFAAAVSFLPFWSPAASSAAKTSAA